jgi:16S rRNA (cytosine967-C5)-methyltransferase
MSIATRQRQIFLNLVEQIRPYWRSDPALPVRIQRVISGNRSFGARDRRLYRELLYTTIRFLPWVEIELEAHPEAGAALVAWLAEDNPSTRDFRAELTSEFPACPEGVHPRAEILGKDPLALVPHWVREECPEILLPSELDALHRRGRLWVRLREPKESDSTAPEGWLLDPSHVLPRAAEAKGEGDLTRTEEYLKGEFEVQDLGSQVILESLGVIPEGIWLDACAGAGGKTLQLADLIGREGRVDAFDIRTEALEELRVRSKRAGLANVHTLTATPNERYDGVLLDLPCSGSGTWRRAPHLKWTTPRDALSHQRERQVLLLRNFAKNVRPGGRLVYATCSLARCENEGVVKDFLKKAPEFEAVEPIQTFGYEWDGIGLPIRPARHDTDGFYVATLRRS